MGRFNTIGKSKQFYDFLKHEILNGEYNPGDKFPSIRDMAKKYGISKITVNSVISNLVTEGLLYVEQGRGTFVAEKKGSTKNKKMIGVMFFDFRIEDNVEAAMFNNIQEHLREGYFVIPYNSYNNNDLFYKGLKGFTELEVDGMILVPPTSENLDKSVLNSLLGKKDIPIVFINRKIPFIKADFIRADFKEGIYKAASHILSKGKKKIALLKHNSPSIGPCMLEGYKRAHRKYHVPVYEELALDEGLDESAMTELIRQIDGFITSDYTIYKLRKTFYECGKRIPDDISIVGINDTIYAKVMNPPLTSITHPSAQMGYEAVRMAMDRIENKRTEAVEKAIVPELIIRSS
jgi:GntR family transcriptional regulator of arabinose operon